MADIKFDFGAENIEEIRKLMQDILKLSLDIKKAMTSSGQITFDHDTQVKKLQLSQLKLNNDLEKQLNIQEKRNAALRVEEGSLKDLTNQYKTLKTALDAKNKASVDPKEVEHLKKLKTQIDAAKSSTDTWGKALQSFQFKFNALGNIASVALTSITTKIFGAVKEMISFDKIINSTQNSADSFAKEMSGLKASFNQLSIAIATGNFGDFFDAVYRASKAAREYADALDNLADKDRQLTIAEADTLKRQSELTEIWKDPQNIYSVKQQISAVQELLDIRTKLASNSSEQSKQYFISEVNRIKGVTGLTDEEIMTYVRLYDKQEELVKIGKELNAINKQRFSGAEVDFKQLSETEKLLENQASLLGADAKALKIYSAMINKFSDEDRDSVVEKYKAWKVADVAYIEENKRLMAALSTLREKNQKDSEAVSEKEIDTWIGIPDAIKAKKKEGSIWDVLLDFPEEKAEAAEDAIKALAEADLQAFTDAERAKLQIAKDYEDQRRQIISETYDTIYALGNALASINNSHMQAELANTELTEAQKLDIKKKYAKKDQAIAISMALINVAEGVTKALTMKPPLGFIYGALIAAQGVAQIAAIKAQKFAKGGEIGGKSHSQGGTMIEAEKGEFVVRKSAYQKNKELINAINAEDSVRIAMALRQDKKIETRKDYTKDLLEYMKTLPVYGETKEFYVVHEGNKIIKIHK